MSKKSLNIEQDKFVGVITKLEEQETFSNRSELFSRVADLYNELYGVSFSSACAAQRAKLWNVELKTQKGEKGNKDGGAALAEWRKSGEVKERAVKGDCSELLKFFAKEEDGKFLPLAKKIKRGSLKSVVKLMCISCAGYERDNVKTCPIKTCPIWAVRPYQ